MDLGEVTPQVVDAVAIVDDPVRDDGVPECGAALGDVDLGAAVVPVDPGEQVVQPLWVDLPTRIGDRGALRDRPLELQRRDAAARDQRPGVEVDAEKVHLGGREKPSIGLVHACEHAPGAVVVEHVCRVPPAEHGIEEPAVEVAVGAARSLFVAAAPRVARSQVQGDADLARSSRSRGGRGARPSRARPSAYATREPRSENPSCQGRVSPRSSRRTRRRKAR